MQIAKPRRTSWIAVGIGVFVMAVGVGLGTGMHRDVLSNASALPASPSGIQDIRRTTRFHYDAGARFVSYSDRASWIVTHTFQFRNSLDKPLELAPEFVSCGCLDYEIDPTIVPPGGRGRVTMTFDTRYRRGRRSEMVILRSGLPEVDALEFVLTVDVYPRIVVLPYGRRIDRVVRDRRPFELSMTLVTYSEDAMEGGGVENPAERAERLLSEISSGFRGRARLTIGRAVVSRRGKVRRTEYPCVLHVDPSALSAPRPFHIDWRAGKARFRTRVVLRCESSIVLRPGTLFFHAGTDDTNEGETRVVLSSEKPFSVTRIDGALDGIRIRPAAGTGRERRTRHEFVVAVETSIPPSRAAGKGRSDEAREQRVVFHTDLDECSEVVLQVWRLMP